MLRSICYCVIEHYILKENSIQLLHACTFEIKFLILNRVTMQNNTSTFEHIAYVRLINGDNLTTKGFVPQTIHGN